MYGIILLNFLFHDLEAVWVGGKIASMINKKGVSSTPWTQSWGKNKVCLVIGSNGRALGEPYQRKVCQEGNFFPVFVTVCDHI